MGALIHNYLFLYTFFFHVHLFFGVANIHIIIIIIEEYDTVDLYSGFTLMIYSD